MFKKTKKRSFGRVGAQTMLGLVMGASTARADVTNFGTLAENITTSIADLPGLLSALAYLIGILLAVLGIMKIKDHVENPGNTPLKEGAIRLVVGGFLFSLPILFDAMSNTPGTDGDGDVQTALTGVAFGIEDGGGGE